MAINLQKLQKGQRINLEKEGGARLTQFCVGCNWGAIVETKTVSGFLGFGTRQVSEEIDVDVDLSCVMLDDTGNIVDTVYSPLYNPAMFQQVGLPVGKDWSADRAMYHTPDDTAGDKGGDDGLDNEIVTVDLAKVNPRIAQIFFFLNIYKPRNIDFQAIPYVSIRMFEGTPDRPPRCVFAQYDVARESQFAGKNALIMGKLYRRGSEWKFAAIGDAYDDQNDLRRTIARIAHDYK